MCSKPTPHSERELRPDEVKRLRVMDFEPSAIGGKTLQWSVLRREGHESYARVADTLEGSGMTDA